MNLKEQINYPEKGIQSKTIIKDENMNVSLFCMSKGTDIEEHTSTKEATVYVMEGQGTFNLERKEIEMKEGTFIRMKSNAKHSLTAKENTSFILTLIKKKN